MVTKGPSGQPGQPHHIVNPSFPSSGLILLFTGESLAENSSTIFPSFNWHFTETLL